MVVSRETIHNKPTRCSMHKRTGKEIHESVLVFVGVSIGVTELACVHLGCADKVLWKRMTCKVTVRTVEDDMQY